MIYATLDSSRSETTRKAMNVALKLAGPFQSLSILHLYPL